MACSLARCINDIEPLQFSGLSCHNTVSAPHRNETKYYTAIVMLCNMINVLYMHIHDEINVGTYWVT